MPGLSMLGDSMIDTGYDAANDRTYNRWISGPLVSALGPVFDRYSNYGVGGETISQCAARVQAVVDDPNEYVLVEPGINDLSRPDTTLDGMVDPYVQMLTALKRAGKKVIVLTVFPRKSIELGGSGLPDKEPIRLQFNNWLVSLRGRGLVDMVIDPPRGVWNPDTEAGDGTHPDNSVTPDLAAYIAESIERLVGEDRPGISDNLIAGLDLYGQSGTSNTAHITGDIPDFWRFLEAQTGTEQIEVRSGMGGAGSATLAFSGAPSGTGVADLFRGDGASASLAQGDLVWAGIDIEHRYLRGLCGVALQMGLPYAGGTRYVSAMYPAGSDVDYRQVPSQMTRRTIWTPPVTISEAVNATLRLYLLYRDNASLSGEIEIWRPQIVKRTA